MGYRFTIIASCRLTIQSSSETALRTAETSASLGDRLLTPR